MDKNFVEDHCFSYQLESRLNKHRYLSQGPLPGAMDAKIFNFINQASKIPNKKHYPSFYHWYILICQFSDAARAKWISNDLNLEEEGDRLVTLCTKDGDHRNNERQNDNKLEKSRCSRTQNCLKQQINDMQYFLNICSKNDIKQRLNQFKFDYQKENQFDTIFQIVQIKRQNTTEGNLYCTNLKVKSIQCQTLKSVISSWADTVTISMKKKKRTPNKIMSQINV